MAGEIPTMHEVENFLRGVVGKDSGAVRYLRAFLAYRVQEILDNPNSSSLRAAIEKYPQAVAAAARENKDYAERLLAALGEAGVLRRQRKVKKSSGGISFEEAAAIVAREVQRVGEIDDALKKILGGDDMAKVDVEAVRAKVGALRKREEDLKTYEEQATRELYSVVAPHFPQAPQPQEKEKLPDYAGRLGSALKVWGEEVDGRERAVTEAERVIEEYLKTE